MAEEVVTAPPTVDGEAPEATAPPAADSETREAAASSITDGEAPQATTPATADNETLDALAPPTANEEAPEASGNEGTEVSMGWYMLSMAIVNTMLVISETVQSVWTCTARPSPSRNAICALLGSSRPFQSIVLAREDPTLIRGPFLEAITPRPATMLTLRGPVPRSYIIYDSACPVMDMNRWVFYIHGGGFVAGDVHAYECFCCELSFRLQCPAFFSEYRLSPEHKLEASFEDICKCYEWLRDNSAPGGEICIVADSSGALLALKLLLHYGGEELIRSAVLISPILDLTFSGDSFTTEAEHDEVLTPGLCELVMRSCMPEGADFGDPSNSPLLGLHAESRLPPMMLVSGEHEICRDDSVRTVARLWNCSEAEARVLAAPGAATPREGCPSPRLVLDIDVHGFHDYPLYYSHVPESREALGRIEAFLSSCWQPLPPLSPRPPSPSPAEAATPPAIS